VLQCLINCIFTLKTIFLYNCVNLRRKSFSKIKVKGFEILAIASIGGVAVFSNFATDHFSGNFSPNGTSSSHTGPNNTGLMSV
jgi:hypothetical protein